MLQLLESIFLYHYFMGKKKIFPLNCYFFILLLFFSISPQRGWRVVPRAPCSRQPRGPHTKDGRGQGSGLLAGREGGFAGAAGGAPPLGRVKRSLLGKVLEALSCTLMSFDHLLGHP